NLTPHWYDFAFINDPASPDFQTGAVFPGQIDPVTGEEVPTGHIHLHFVAARRGDNNLIPGGPVGIVDPGGPAFGLPLLAMLPPVGRADSYSVREDETLTVPAAGVLANDRGPAGRPLTTVLVRGPAHGRLTLAPGGGFRYVPDPNFNGRDSFLYAVTDGQVESDPAAVTLTVLAVPDPLVRRGAVLVVPGMPSETAVVRFRWLAQKA